MASQAVLGVATVLLLLASNCFMNTAWYLHLKFKAWPMVVAIFASWGLAGIEYCFAVPANRLGHYSQGGPFSAPQLKVIQEALSLSTFAIFSIVVLKEKLRWTDAIAFALIFSGVAVALAKPASKGGAEGSPSPELALPPAPQVAPEPEGLLAAAVESLQAPLAEPVGGRRMLELTAQQQQQQKDGGKGVGDSKVQAASAGSSPAPSISEQLERQEAALPGAQPQPLASEGSEALRREGSATVLLASGYGGIYARSSQQGVHSRAHSHDPEAPPEGEEEQPASRAAQQ